MEENVIFEHINAERVYSNLISKINPTHQLKQNYLPDLNTTNQSSIRKSSLGNQLVFLNESIIDTETTVKKQENSP